MYHPPLSHVVAHNRIDRLRDNLEGRVHTRLVQPRDIQGVYRPVLDREGRLGHADVTGVFLPHPKGLAEQLL